MKPLTLKAGDACEWRRRIDLLEPWRRGVVLAVDPRYPGNAYKVKSDNRVFRNPMWLAGDLIREIP